MNRSAVVLCASTAAIAGFTAGYVPHLHHGAVERRALYYVDPMHPAYRSTKPGKAPDCGMDLAPVFAEDVGNGLSSTASTPGLLNVSAATQQQYGIRLAQVHRLEGKDTVRIFGRVAVDETRVYRVNLGTDGYVKETHADAVGDRVRKDQRLATVYSPEFLSVVGGYLSANERTPPSPAIMSRENLPAPANAASAQARADRLRNLGMSEAQINEVSQTRKIPEDVYLVSPSDGIIMARNISPGSRFDRHTDLYTIADLSHVWIVAQVFGDDAHALRPGTSATIRIAETGEIAMAKVSDILPQIDPVSHALTVRLEAANRSLHLRPDMFVTVEVSAPRAVGFVVPADAVLDSGRSKRVFVQVTDGIFEPREVQTGWTLNDEVQIVRGLQTGETVASAGTFLLDSESRLKSGIPLAGIGHGTAR